MTTAVENKLLTNIGPGTEMGSLLREYWAPALRSERIGEPDSAPARVRLFGENFVAFRATDGRVGFLDETCPHRGASLALARNEECGLRCIYHGWKIDVSGVVVDVPSEPKERTGFGAKVPVGHYPVVEAGGIVWVYLGTAEEPPQFPAFEFTTMPDDHVFPLVAVLECNWLQALEGGIDSSHVSMLHQSEIRKSNKGNLGKILEDTAPRFEVDFTDYGFRIGSVRETVEGGAYVRVTQFVMPWYTFVPEQPGFDRLWHAWVPIDDTHTLVWYLWYNPDRPVQPEDWAHMYAIDLDDIRPDDFRWNYRPENWWRQDREAMRSGDNFAGVPGIGFEDIAVQESMGPIIDRSKEHLGSSDHAIIKARRLFRKAIEEHQSGGVPFGQDSKLSYEELRSDAVLVGPDEDWRDVSAVVTAT